MRIECRTAANSMLHGDKRLRSPCQSVPRIAPAINRVSTSVGCPLQLVSIAGFPERELTILLLNIFKAKYLYFVCHLPP